MTGKWSNHTLAKPANVPYLMIKALVPVPGSNQAFALAWADIDSVRNGFVLHWGSNTNSGTWKLIKQASSYVNAALARAAGSSVTRGSLAHSMLHTA